MVVVVVVVMFRMVVVMMMMVVFFFLHTLNGHGLLFALVPSGAVVALCNPSGFGSAGV